MIWSNLAELDTTVKQNVFHVRCHLFLLYEMFFIIWNTYLRWSLISLSSCYGFGLENTDCPLSTTSRSWWSFVFMGKETRLILAKLWFLKNYRSLSEQLSVQHHGLWNPSSVNQEKKLAYNSTYSEKRYKEQLWISILNVQMSTLKWTVNFIFPSLCHYVATSVRVEYGQMFFLFTSGLIILFGHMV